MMFTILSALAVMALRIGLYYAGHPLEGTSFMLVHLLALVTIVWFTGHRALTHDRETPFPALLRETFRNAALYALLIGLFLWAYFSWLESDHFAFRIDELVARGMAEGQPEAVIRPRMEAFFTPLNYATISFLALLAAGAFNTLFIGILQHKVLRRFMR